MGLDGVGSNAYIYQPQNNLNVNTQQTQTQTLAPGMGMDQSLFNVQQESTPIFGTPQGTETSSTQVSDNYSTAYLQQNPDTLDMLAFLCGGDNATLSTNQKLDLLQNNFTNIQVGGVPTSISSSFPSWVDASNVLCVTNNDGTTDFYSGDIKVGMQTPGETTTVIESYNDNGEVTTRQEIANSGSERTIETFGQNHTKTNIRGNVTTTLNPDTNQPETVKTPIGNACVQTDSYTYNPDGSYTITTSGNEVHPENNGVRNYNADGTRFANEAFSEGLTNGQATATLNGKNGGISNDGIASNISVKDGVTYSADGFPTAITVELPQGKTNLTYVGDGIYTNKANDLSYEIHSDANGNLSIDTAKGAQRDANMERARQAHQTQQTQEAQENATQNTIESSPEQQKHIETVRKNASKYAEELYNIMDGINFKQGKEREEIFGILDQMTPEEMAYTVLAFRSQNNGRESLAECILDETAMTNGMGLDNQYGTKAMRMIGNKLASFAESKGIDTTEYKKITYKESSYDVLSNRHNVENFDTLFEGMAMAATTRNELSPAQLQQINNMSDAQKMELSKSVNSYMVGEALRSIANYRADEGWAGYVADGISVLWNSDNRMKNVQADLDAANNIERTLNNITDPVEYAAKFEEVYGIKFDPTAVAAYSQIRNNVIKANEAYSTEQVIDQQASYFLKHPVLVEERTIPDENGISTVIRSEERILSDEKSKLVALFGNGDSTIGELRLNIAMQDMGVNPETATRDQMYSAMRKIAQNVHNKAHEATMEATGGVNFLNYKKQCDDAYYTAFGTKQDVMKRANDYIISQRVGEAVVKSTAKVAVAAVATACGNPAAAALIIAGSNFALDTSNQLFTQHFINRCKMYDGDLWKAASETLPPEDLAKFAKSALVDGALTLTGAGYARIFSTFDSTILKAMGTTLANTTTATIADATINGGEITLDGVVIKLAFSTAGSLIGFRVKPDGKPQALIGNMTKNTGGVINADINAQNQINDFLLDLDGTTALR